MPQPRGCARLKATLGRTGAVAGCHDGAVIGQKWGVSESETTLRYTCDEFVPSPTLEAWRGVTVRATPPIVWSWLTQVRVAPYSYDWIDNRGRRSPPWLLGLAEPRVGEAFTTSGRRELGRILSVDRERQLTAPIRGAHMSYLLVPAGQGSTRLLLKVVMTTSRLIAPALAIGDLIMARRQLLNLKQLAEREPTTGRPEC